jgi:3-phenylpropionate/cinnamic acid dioxygenase small subunit
MPFTLEQLSDRAEIQDLLVREAHALDKGHWDAWEQTFTPDADIDYSENDGARGRPAEIRVWLAETFATFPAAQHLTSNTEIELHGDHATARSMQYIGVDMVYQGEKRVVISGIWFYDELTRTPDGWRIHKRHEELAWRHNFPENFAPPVPAQQVGG